VHAVGTILLDVQLLPNDADSVRMAWRDITNVQASGLITSTSINTGILVTVSGSGIISLAFTSIDSKP
jgi:hypothetical protein